MPTQWIERTRDFLTRDIWRLRIRHLTRARALGIRLLRVMVLALRGFRDDQCHLRASGLTFFTLLSVSQTPPAVGF